MRPVVVVDVPCAARLENENPIKETYGMRRGDTDEVRPAKLGARAQ